MSKIRFPNESAAYRDARNALLESEIALRQSVADVAAARARLPLGGEVPSDYVFTRAGSDGQTLQVRLSAMFPAEQQSLLVYSFMYGPDMREPCPMCTSMLDALNGNARQICERVGLAVVASSGIERIAKFADERGWKDLAMYSAAGNSYQRDYFGEDADGMQMPMANVFVRKNGHLHHFWGAEMLYAEIEGQPRHVDMLWPLWNAFDLTPDGRGSDWYPRLARRNECHSP